MGLRRIFPNNKAKCSRGRQRYGEFDSYTVTIVSAIGGQVTYISTGNSGTVDSGQQTTIQMNYGSSLSLGALPATGYGYSFKGMDKLITFNRDSESIITINNLNHKRRWHYNRYIPIGQLPIIVTFSESGLDSGTFWQVTFNGQTQSSTSNSISYSVGSAGSFYPWSLSPPNGYTASQTSGNLYVSGSSGNQLVTFQKQTSTNTAAKTATTTLLTLTLDPVTVSSPLTCTATVTGINPTGTITWRSSSSTRSLQNKPINTSRRKQFCYLH